ncbi:UDP-galactopyranose mutase [Alteromonas sp. ASW11-130]|uniref:UDP-galactopyranose mutase n=1 Tax=Alteromonas sp. ASW11-130 TaxID=3015775 RepID=UPI0022419BA5|nr:UDP-galactopyranose mutase [Alteromonas sp. ASW11-130]MCW8090342.1 UDP-galactopyranose mutase [Alteromonas sp. ASW11-130]
MSSYDAIVVGAGISGAVIAERLASQQNKKVLVLEQRNHIGGNCYDYKDENGIIIHQYGPHLFHTNKQEVWNYLSQFTEWYPYEHKVLSSVDGKLVPIPFNFSSLEKMYSYTKSEELKELLLEEYGEGARVAILDLMKSTHPQLNELAQLIYDKFFVNYTTKQWGVKPEDISPQVTARVPIVLSYDDRYFQDKWQAVPMNGYTAMFGKMLRHPNITVKLETDALDYITLQHNQIYFKNQRFKGLMIYTGMLDRLFDLVKGELPYRSLKFQYETHAYSQYQSATTVNYPNDYAFTRITEFKHIVPVDSAHTVIVKEFPGDFNTSNADFNVPYYPMFNKENASRHAEYNRLAEQFSNLKILGRLADYRYYNMDDAVANALHIYEALKI